MEDFYFAVQELEQFPVMMACLLAVIAYGFIREVAQSGGLAMVSVPFVFAGSLTSYALLNANSIILVDDKDTNVVSGLAIGMLASFAILMVGYWLVMLISERRSAAKKLKPLTGTMRGAK